ncbi:MAG TPA: TetR/AcrR family transcriptional regulator [Mycobacteriales bacterium]|nr:TetR/AcrR family transcriptional regulator [Mycobacteriales bacterium]
MTEPLEPLEATSASWVERAADRSPSVQRSRTRSVKRAQQLVEAAKRLVLEKGSAFTTQELVKEAGIAVQTFYKYFEGKDQVLLAVFEELISEACAGLETAARELPDPVSRLRFYIRSIVLAINDRGDGGPRFITSEHWRLHQLYPAELARATGGFARLLLPEIRAAQETGALRPANAEYDAWLIQQLVISVFHHYEYASHPESAETIGDRLWDFCFAALGGRADGAAPVSSRRSVRRRS